MEDRHWFRRIACLAVIVVALAAASPAHAQGCALCYNTAAAAKASGIRALKNGILILLVPPLVICSGIIVLGIRARNRFNEPEGWSHEEEACRLEIIRGAVVPNAGGPEARAPSGAVLESLVFHHDPKHS